MGLILRSVACLLLLTLVYHAALAWLPVAHPHGREADLALSARNRDRAEAYVARATPPEVVLVGSSIAGRLRRSLPADWEVLAFDGGTPLTGLEIIARHDPKPRVVVVELNRPLAPLDRDLVEPLFDPVARRLAAWLPGLLEANRPSQRALVVARALRTAATGGRSEAARVAAPEQRPELREEILALNRERYAKPPLRSELRARLDDIAAAIGRLERAGVAVWLVDIPEDPALDAAPGLRTIRTRVGSVFPPTRYRWLPRPDARAVAEHFPTTDGEHLTRTAADAYAAALQTWLSSATQAAR